MMITYSIALLLGLGFLAGLLLAVASRVLYVYEDPRIAQVQDALPGANCGGCGYPGCYGAAKGVVSGEAPCNVCVIGGMETAAKVAEVMGEEVEFTEPRIAVVDCSGGERAEQIYLYQGAHDCVAQHQLHGGSKWCQEGCLGLGSCVRACPFDAIHMGPHGYPVVDPDKCTSCGNCVRTCPRDVIDLFSRSEKLRHLNRTSDCLAPCRQRCPGSINIPAYIRAARHGDYAEAVRVLRERIPLLLVCGRVCPHPCEEACRRGHVDYPIAINNIKRYVSDWEMNSGQRLPIECAPDTHRKVAVVGGGPAGISCAYFLRRFGHAPTIFEAMPKLGGQLRYGIPEYRLPKHVLDWELDGILELGIKVLTNKKLGLDFTLDDLRDQGFEAVFLGLGAWQPGNLRCENEDAPGVLGGTEFLTEVGLGLKTGLGKKVVVVGGGNTAIDAARTAVRLGADVTLMYRRTREEMPANVAEIDAAEHENVEFLFLAQQTRVVLDDQGRTAGLEYRRMELGEPDESGRRKPTPVEGSETVIQADTVIGAIGQRPDLECLYQDGECPFDETRWRTLSADPLTMRTSVPDVFVGGDVYTGPDLVISALGGGRKAARAIHFHLQNPDREIPVPDDAQKDLIAETLFTTLEDVRPCDRVVQPEIEAKARCDNFREVECTISEEQCRYEACRCMDCGLTCYDRDPEAIREGPLSPPADPGFPEAAPRGKD